MPNAECKVLQPIKWQGKVYKSGTVSLPFVVAAEHEKSGHVARLAGTIESLHKGEVKGPPAGALLANQGDAGDTTSGEGKSAGEGAGNGTDANAGDESGESNAGNADTSKAEAAKAPPAPKKAAAKKAAKKKAKK